MITKMMVLIESDWNLKGGYEMLKAETVAVLIESDWNLKSSAASSMSSA